MTATQDFSQNESHSFTSAGPPPATDQEESKEKICIIEQSLAPPSKEETLQTVQER